MVRHLCFAIAFGLSAAAPAWADTSSEDMQRFIDSADNRQAVMNAVHQEWAPVVGADCPALTASDWQSGLYQPLQFGPDGKIQKGLWKQSVTVTGCGTAKLFNVASFVRADGSINRIGMLPGTSRADPILERDATKEAGAAATPILKECKNAVVTDTAFVAEEGPANQQVMPGHAAEPWREQWTVKGCGAAALVIMHFSPNATGTGITASPNDTKPAP